MQGDKLFPNRPSTLPSMTFKYEFACGRKYIVISHDGKFNPQEFFIFNDNRGKEGSCSNAYAAFAGKLGSVILRANIKDPEIKRLMIEAELKQLSEITCESGTWNDGIFTKSCFHAIAQCLEEIMSRREINDRNK